MLTNFNVQPVLRLTKFSGFSLRQLKATVYPALLMLVIGCSQSAHQAAPLGQYHQQQLLVFGTLVDITIDVADAALAEQGSKSISDLFAKLHDTLHSWEPSALQQVNQQLALGKPAKLDATMADLIQSGQTLSLQSNELFNPAIGKFIKLWGFHANDWDSQTPPQPAQVKALLQQRPSMRDLVIRDASLRSTNPAVQLDFGAFAKGYAIDRAIAHLQKLGIQNAVINAGGDLRAIGSKSGKPWRIGIRAPRKPGIIATIDTDQDESVFSSGDYERFYVHKGVRYHHIIDPRIGMPARGTRSVTVIHERAQVADAAATALFVAGPSQWFSIARKMGIKFVLLIDDQGHFHMTPNMNARVQWTADAPVKVHLSPPL